METSYVAWLKTQPVRLFESDGMYWRAYNRALLPASPSPHFLSVRRDAAKKLLETSGAWFLRYTSHPTEAESPWWYVVCDQRSRRSLSSKVRNQIRYAHRQCQVQRIDASAIAQNGYEVYLAAHDRYENARPMNRETFEANALGTLQGPIEYWGVFVKAKLVGYCQCNIDDANADIGVMRLDPAHLKSYSAYALVSDLINHYTMERSFNLSNGERSIAHQTNFQNFLLKFGFRKQFCRLNIFYQPLLESVVKILFPLRDQVIRLPDRNILHQIRSLLVQEEIRRSCH